MNVLVVEDEALVAQDLSETLHALGHTVVGVARTADAATGLLERTSPEIVLLDVTLAGDRDGISVAAAVRDRGVPFVFVTAHADPATVRRAAAERPDGYLVKPFDRDGVYAAVEVALARYADREAQPPPTPGDATGLGDEALGRVVRYVDDHAHESPSLDDLAAVAHLSRYHFARLFKAAVGQTPHRYVLARRVEAAGRLLRETDDPVTQVALATGFASPSHFSSVFKDHTGQTPSEHRRGAGEAPLHG